MSDWEVVPVLLKQRRVVHDARVIHFDSALDAAQVV